MSDLFLSYRTRHAAEVQPLLAALADAGVDVWRDEARIDAGSSITDSVRNGLASSRAILVWCSPDYMESVVCRWELRTAWIAAESAGPPTDRVFLLLPPGRTDPRTFLPAEALGPQIDTSWFRWPTEPAGFAALARQLREKLPAGTLAALHRFDTAVPWPLRKPLSSERFVGRDRELWQMHGLLQAHRHVAVTGVDRVRTTQVRGLGGIGKTLLVTEYALLFQGAWPGGVYWFDVGTQSPEDLLRTVMTVVG